MSFPPKLVTILCLLQFLFVTMGFLLTRGFLKVYHQVAPGMLGSHAPLIPALPRFIHDFGLWFLLVPLAWCVVAVVRGEVTQGIASLSFAQLMTGIVLTVGVILVFSFSALAAYRIASNPF
jgi:hypothetical protein